MRDLEGPTELPQLPDGFRYRTVGADDVPERVSIHREVWAPSRVTKSSYAQVRAEWPYRASLDCIVQAPDGPVAAYCLCWPDDMHRVGEFDPRGPAGVPPSRARRRRPHVRTHATYEESGRQAIAYCASAPACELYQSLGFRIHASLVGYGRPAR